MRDSGQGARELNVDEATPDLGGDVEPSHATDTSTPSAGRRRLAFWSGVAVLTVLGAGIVWIAITGLLARSQLAKVRADLPKLRQAVVDGRTADARRLADRIRDESTRAHALTTGPAWWVAANLPVVGTPLQTTRTITATAGRIGTEVVPAVVALAEKVSHTRLTNSTVDLEPLRRLAPALHRAAATITRLTADLRSSDGSWLGPVRAARTSMLRQLVRVDGELTGADRAVRLAVPLLGGDRPQRYFIAFLNEAEARGVGGIPGAFAIATMDHGRLTFDHFGSDLEFRHVRAKVDLGAEYNAIYGQDDPTGTYPNSDLSPDFRNAARIWAGLWQARSGQPVDAAIALDPTALGYLLAVTGPAHTPAGEVISSDNVVALTQRDLYRRFGNGTRADDAARKAYVVGLARAISRRLAAGGNPQRLVRAVSRAATEHRFLAWSADPAIEREIAAATWAGALPDASTPASGFVVNNAAGSKLDYYLDRSFSYARSSCSAGAVATATLRLTNGAPSGLPTYVTVRADTAGAASRPGDNRLLVTYYASVGAKIRSISLDGRALRFATAPENGLTTVTLDVELPRTATRTLRVVVEEPAASAPVQVIRQPLARALDVAVRQPHCG
jgi:hypothetical protein